MKVDCEGGGDYGLDRRQRIRKKVNVNGEGECEWRRREEEEGGGVVRSE